MKKQRRTPADFVGPRFSRGQASGVSVRRNRTANDLHDWLHFFGGDWIGAHQWCGVHYPHEVYNPRTNGARAWSRLLVNLQLCGVGFERRQAHNPDAKSREQVAVLRTEIRLGDDARRWLASADRMAGIGTDPAESDAEVWAKFHAAEDRRLAAP